MRGGNDEKSLPHYANTSAADHFMFYSLLAELLHPEHEALGIVIGAVSAVPNQPSGDVLSEIVKGGGKVGDDGQGSILVAGAVADPPVRGAAGVLLRNEVHGVHEMDHVL